MVIRLCMPSMRQAPRLLTRRYEARRADLRNREIIGPNARRIEYARWRVAQGGLTEW